MWVMQVFRLRPYLRAMRSMGINESGMSEIERIICVAPESHPMIRGLRGVRKARFARRGTGKSGGGRAIYYLMAGAGRIYMMTAYAKSRQEDLTIDDRKAILRVIDQLLSGEPL
jgi:hypothetical protein